MNLYTQQRNFQTVMKGSWKAMPIGKRDIYITGENISLFLVEPVGGRYCNVKLEVVKSMRD